MVLLAALTAGGARAEGFAVKNLTAVAANAKAALGGDFIHKVDPERLTLTCPTCKGAPMIDVLIGRQADGTEERVRSGRTPISRLEELCRAKSPTCRIEGLKVAPAVGWISAYPMGPFKGSTAIILRGGDLLTIRSLASDAGVAKANAERLVSTVAPTIIGK